MTVQWETKAPAGTGSPGSTNSDEVVLDVKGLKVYYATPTGDVKAVDGVDFQIFQGEIVGLVGESGCGKTTTAMAILRLVQPPGRIVEGEVNLAGKNVAELNERDLRDFRWSSMALIPQGAMNSLNPIMRIHEQVSDSIIAHEGRQNRSELKERILNLFSMVGLLSRVYNMYPHELRNED
jgi:peptide/nickel transport system ATP-binding protein